MDEKVNKLVETLVDKIQSELDALGKHDVKGLEKLTNIVQSTVWTIKDMKKEKKDD